MELNFLCPKCGQIITEKDFDQSEQSLKHLHEFFKSKELTFKNELKQELLGVLEKQKETELESLKNSLESKYIKQITELSGEINSLKQQQNTLLAAKTSEIELANKAIINEQALEIAKLKADLSAQDTKNQLSMQSVLEQNRLEYDKKLAEAAEKIKEFEIANALNKVIQNKTKGENFEHDVEGELRKVFTEDIIEKITDGRQKADYRQIIKVNNEIIGKIVYEVKNAEWKNTWEKKLTEDMAREEAKYGILVATSFNDQYRGIPFKVSDQNPNIFLTDADSFPFVGNIVRILLKTEQALTAKYQQQDQSAKLKEFNNWRDNTFKVVSKTFEDQFKRIEDSEKAITNKVDEIRIAREKVSGQWLKVVKTFIEGLNL